MFGTTQLVSRATCAVHNFRGVVLGPPIKRGRRGLSQETVHNTVLSIEKGGRNADVFFFLKTGLGYNLHASVPCRVPVSSS